MFYRRNLFGTSITLILMSAMIVSFNGCDKANEVDNIVKRERSFKDPFEGQEMLMHAKFQRLDIPKKTDAHLEGFSRLYLNGKSFLRLDTGDTPTNFVIHDIPKTMEEIGVITESGLQGEYLLMPKLSFLPRYVLSNFASFDGRIVFDAEPMDETNRRYRFSLYSEEFKATDVVDGTLPLQRNGYSQLRVFPPVILAIAGAITVTGSAIHCMYERSRQATSCHNAYAREQARDRGRDCNFHYKYGACGGTCTIDCD